MLAPETPESASSPPTSSFVPLAPLPLAPPLPLPRPSYDDVTSGAGVVVDSENELFMTGAELPYRRRREIH